MASMTTNVVKRRVERVISEEIEEKTYTLTLSQEEAEVLKRIVGRVGGYPKATEIAGILYNLLPDSQDVSWGWDSSYSRLMAVNK